jgi:hypothetical protein
VTVPVDETPPLTEVGFRLTDISVPGLMVRVAFCGVLASVAVTVDVV